MKATRLWLLLCGCLAISPAACGTDDGSDPDPSACGDDATELAASSVTLCVYEGAITETGFECPDGFGYDYGFGDLRVCTDGELPPTDVEVICDEFGGSFAWQWRDETEECVDENEEPIDLAPIDDSTDPVSCSNNGDECAEDEYCAQTMPPYCSVDWIGTCEPRPETCPTGGMGVCDCDGNEIGTWTNLCEARASGFGGVAYDCVDVQCPPVVDPDQACPEGCFPMRARPYNETDMCLETLMVVGCTPDEGGTGDVVCFVHPDSGAPFMATSGSPFRNSGVWVECDAPLDEEVPTADSCQ